MVSKREQKVSKEWAKMSVSSGNHEKKESEKHAQKSSEKHEQTVSKIGPCYRP
jgi:hypothetical protein